MTQKHYESPVSPLGSRLEVFFPWRANVYAGYVLTGLLVFGGFGLIVWGLADFVMAVKLPPNSEERKAAGFGSLRAVVGFVLLLPAAAFWWYTRAVARCRVEVCEHGFRHHVFGSSEVVVLWVDVARMEEHFVEDHVPPELSPMDLLLTPTIIRQFVVIHRDGRAFTFDRETVRYLGRLGQLLKDRAEQHAIPWAIIQPA